MKGEYYAVNEGGGYLVKAACRGCRWSPVFMSRDRPPSSIRGLSPLALAFLGRDRFIASYLRRPFLGEYRRGQRHFWSRQVSLGHGPPTGPTFRFVERMTNSLIWWPSLTVVVTWLRLPDVGGGGAQHSHLATRTPRASGSVLQALTLLSGARFITWWLRNPILG